MVLFTTFVNCRLCINGEVVDEQLVTSEESGKILKRTGYIGGEAVDLEGGIIAPGYLELQTNGMLGFHFATFKGESNYVAGLERVSKYLVTKGVTGFWGTVPTVKDEDWQKILPHLSPKEFVDSADLLGAHAEGPYLHPSKKGAHSAELFRNSAECSIEATYGSENIRTSLKLVTLAPEQPGSIATITALRSRGIRTSLGHSSASYEQGREALDSGACALTHVFNAMNPLHHRNPGLAGLMAAPSPPFYSLIADGTHLSPAILAMAFRANPEKCILISDSVELLGMPDGVYPPNAQIHHRQEKIGNLITIYDSDPKTRIGSCCDLEQCVRNLMAASGCSLGQAVRCVTENIADMMGLEDRGKLEEGRRADFVVLNDEGEILQTWIGGKKVWQRD